MSEFLKQTAIIELLASGTTDPDLAQFLDREWASWHASQGYDSSVDWSSRSIALVARDAEGAIIGAATGRMRAGVGRLSELLVTEKMRGVGIGSRLARQFEIQCWAHGCHKITVHTDCEGPAAGFYKRRGWQEEAVFTRDRGGRDFVRLCKFNAE